MSIIIDYHENRANKLSLAAIPDAISHGVMIRVYRYYHIQHDKVMIIVLETGSFNYTSTTEKENSENILVLRYIPQVIERFHEHFETRWKYGAPYQKGDLECS